MQHIAGLSRQQLQISSLEDKIALDNPVRFIEAFVEYISLEALGFTLRTIKSDGRPSFDIKLFLKIYLYGYLNGLRSSRKLEKECVRNIELQWLLEDIRPNYHSISDFRKDNPIAIIDVRFATYMQIYETPILTKYLSEVTKQGIIIRKKKVCKKHIFLYLQ